MSLVSTGVALFFYTLQNERIFWVANTGITIGSDINYLPNEVMVFDNSVSAFRYWKEHYSFIQYDILETIAISRYIADEGTIE